MCLVSHFDVLYSHLFLKGWFHHQKANVNSEILEVFKQVKINIPLLDAIKQISSYAKFLKDLCTIKMKFNIQKKTFLTKQVSSIIQHNTPPKYKDPGCLTIACFIGKFKNWTHITWLRS